MKERLEKVLFWLAVAAGTLVLSIRIHTYTTGGDPRTFLLIARDFAGGPTVLDRHLVVPGWPLVLAGVIRLFGLHAAFWTNVPLFVLLVWTIRGLVKAVSGRAGRSAAVAAAAALVMLGGYVLNPHFLLWAFRQTPMYLTGMLAMLCVSHAVRRQAGGRLVAATAWLGLAGLAAGAGTIVRETGVLMLPAMGLYLLANALGWAGPTAGRGSPVRHRWFLTGLLAGAVVAVAVAGAVAVFVFHVHGTSLQSGYLMQMFLSLLARPFGETPWCIMLHELPTVFGWGGCALLGLGLCAAFRRSEREYLFFFFLPALCYWGFDGMLHHFHWRFFLSTQVFLAPLLPIGACAVWDWGRRMLPRPAMEKFSGQWVRMILPVAVCLLLGGWWLHLVRHVVSWAPRTSRADVEHALEVLSPWVGTERPLLVDWRSRYLTELLEVFTEWPTEAVEPARALTYLRTPALVYARALNEAALYDHGFVGYPADPVLEGNARLVPVPGESDFALGEAEFRLLQVLPWTECHAEIRLPPAPESCLTPEPAAVLLRVAAPAAAATNAIRVSLMDRPLADCLRPGFNFLPVPRNLLDALEEAGGGELRFEADSPIPEDFSPEWIPPCTPLEMEFGLLRQPSCNAYLSDEFMAFVDIPKPDRNYPFWPIRDWALEFADGGLIHLPEGLEGDGGADATYSATLVLRPVFDAPDGTFSVTVSLPEFPDIAPQTFSVPHSEEIRIFRFDFGVLPHAPTVLRMQVDHDMDPPPRISANPRHRNVHLVLFGFEVGWRADSIAIPLGRPWDDAQLKSGFHAREGSRTPRHGRWTDACAEIDMPLRRGPAYRVELDYDQYRPESVPPASPRLEWNGQPLEATPTDTGLAAVVAGELIGNSNTLRILCETWSPSDFGAGDKRNLGIYLRNIRVSPLPDR